MESVLAYVARYGHISRLSGFEDSGIEPFRTVDEKSIKGMYIEPTIEQKS